jgi:hypothetical protein
MANRGFIRFVDITRANAATIDGCYAKLTAYGATAGATVKLTLGFATGNNPAAPTSVTELAALTMTTATVSWEPGEWLDGEAYLTPDLKTPMQEIVDQGTWASGHAVILLMDDNSSDENAYRLLSSFDYDSGSEKAVLYISQVAA